MNRLTINHIPRLSPLHRDAFPLPWPGFTNRFRFGIIMVISCSCMMSDSDTLASLDGFAASQSAHIFSGMGLSGWTWRIVSKVIILVSEDAACF